MEFAASVSGTGSCPGAEEPIHAAPATQDGAGPSGEGVTQAPFAQGTTHSKWG